MWVPGAKVAPQLVEQLHKFDSPPEKAEANSEKTDQTSLSFEFLADGVVNAATFSKRPFGIMFTNELPLTVASVAPGTEAEHQNVQPGWVVSKVAGVSLAFMKLEDTVNLIKEKSRNLACPPSSAQAGRPTSISFEFNVSGDYKTVTFHKRPLGMTFGNGLPLTVSNVVADSEAETRGVQVGWVFTKVADVPLQGMDLQRIVSLILENSLNLPVDDG